ncbi:Predicted pyrophosphatase or phosphodiesterase, AlkP superfamily [Chitinophaga rupis]|uniref:Predicted pyrophosphatase or phosphodiesterase, AlkP superfamily n=1 Tax=Chitinophaga rupis TaxID=573321 RepID=A0A1H7PJB6_9BACT|nr:ectonucleotide pyrophosphatase/phosphodiesterase [Chitinophaga rupis]SEL35147.1 Predicted pyrophosphatase or phosphodiesterase, AlkP superfamily [Chitinophaga rupis]
MNWNCKRIALAVTLVLTGAFAARAQKAKYVVMISIDGLRPDFYREATWPTPNLHWLAAEGVSADGVRGVLPTVTYPSHTTIMTGVMPARHGIYYNTPFEREGQTGRWNWENNLIKTTTLWQAVKQKGGTTAAVHWPVTVGATYIDYNLPESPKGKPGEDPLKPMRDASTPKGLFEEAEKNAIGKLDTADIGGDYLSMDEDIARLTSYLVQTYKPSLTTVHLVCVDHFEHLGGRQGLGVDRAIANADRAVGHIMEAVEKAGIKDSTVIMIVGDHGFVDIHTLFAPNVWLAKAGLMEDKKDRGNWKATFHAQGGSTFLYLRDKNDQQTLNKVKEVLRSMPAAQQKLFRIVEKEELTKIGADPEVQLALAAKQGIAFSDAAGGEPLKPAKGGTHGYFPDFHNIETGFIAYGPGLKKDVVIPAMGLEDIAPLVAHLMGLTMPGGEGVEYPGCFKDK